MQLQQHNTIYGLTKICVTDRGFKRNLTQLTGRYEQILIHLYVLLNRASIIEPFSATCGLKIVIEPSKKLIRRFEYSKPDNLKKLSTLTQILSLL